LTASSSSVADYASNLLAHWLTGLILLFVEVEYSVAVVVLLLLLLLLRRLLSLSWLPAGCGW